VVLNNLFKRTALQQSFAGNMMAVLGGGRMPELLTLRRSLLEFVDFRVECVQLTLSLALSLALTVTLTLTLSLSLALALTLTPSLPRCVQRRTAFELKKAETRLHLVEGLLVALSRLDEVVDAIRQARGAAEARTLLESAAFGLSREQAEAILSMQLRRLTALEGESLGAEAETLRAQTAALQLLLAERPRVLELIKEELAELKAKYATPRRTLIGDDVKDFTDAELITEQSAVIITTADGFIKRLPLDELSAQRRGTRGKAGMNLGKSGKADDEVVRVFACSSHDSVLCISGRGVAYAVPAFRIPSASRTAKGVPLHQLLPIEPEERIATVMPVTPAQLASEAVFLLLLTRQGWIKKTPLKAFARITARGLTATKIKEEDEVLRCDLCSAHDSVLLATKGGFSLRFATDEKQLRGSGRLSRGVRSIALRDGDEVTDMSVVVNSSSAARDAIHVAGGGVGVAPSGPPVQKQMLLAVTRDGYGKRVEASAFGKKGRGGMGMIAIKFKESGDSLAALTQASDDEQVLLITQKGTIVRQKVSAISLQGRAATGVQLQKLDPNDYVASVAIVPAEFGRATEDDGEEAEEGEDGPEEEAA